MYSLVDTLCRFHITSAKVSLPILCPFDGLYLHEASKAFSQRLYLRFFLFEMHFFYNVNIIAMNRVLAKAKRRR